MRARQPALQGQGRAVLDPGEFDVAELAVGVAPRHRDRRAPFVRDLVSGVPVAREGEQAQQPRLVRGSGTSQARHGGRRFVLTGLKLRLRQRREPGDGWVGGRRHRSEEPRGKVDGRAQRWLSLERPHSRRPNGGPREVAPQGLRQHPDVRTLRHMRGLPGAPRDRLVLLGPSLNRVREGPYGCPAGRSIVELMEGAFPEQDDQTGTGQLHGPPERVEIDEPAPGSVEPLVVTVKPLPPLPAKKQGGRLEDRREPPVRGGAVEGGDLEQAIPVSRPTDGLEQAVLALPRVAAVDGPSLSCVEAEVPAEGGDHGLAVEPGPAAGEVQQTRAHHAGAVDHDSDDVGSGRGDPYVDGAGWRGRSVLDAQDPEVAVQPIEEALVHGRRGSVVDDHDLVFLAPDVALVVRGQESSVRRASRGMSCTTTTIETSGRGWSSATLVAFAFRRD